VSEIFSPSFPVGLMSRLILVVPNELSITLIIKGFKDKLKRVLVPVVVVVVVGVLAILL